MIGATLVVGAGAAAARAGAGAGAGARAVPGCLIVFDAFALAPLGIVASPAQRLLLGLDDLPVILSLPLVHAADPVDGVDVVVGRDLQDGDDLDVVLPGHRRPL